MHIPTRTQLGLGTVLLAVSVASMASGQATPRRPGTLFGRVFDDSEVTPLGGTRVAVLGTRALVTADAGGSFIISLERAAPLTLMLTRLGYRPLLLSVDVQEGDTTRLSFYLSRLPRSLDTIRVTDERTETSPRLAGFERRSRGGVGTFIRRADIEKYHPVSTASLFLRINGVRIVDSAGVKLLASARGMRISPRANLADLAPCYLAVGVDGQLKDWGFSVDEIDPQDIFAIEIYKGPSTVPRELLSLTQNGYCGLVMIWTRA
jgi:hypothetical protein